MINEEQLLLIISKINIIRNDESINFDDIKNVFNDLTQNYKSSSTADINNLLVNVYQKFSTVLNTHENYRIVLEKKIEQYKLTAASVKNMIANIDYSLGGYDE